MKTTMKKLAALLMAVCMVLCFAACGDSSDSSDNSGEGNGDGGSATAEATGGVEIPDSGYSIDTSDGDVYAYYGVKFKNNSDSDAYEFTTITITAKDAEGTVIASEDQMMNTLQPGEEQAFGSSLDCNGEKPETIEFTIDEGDEIYADESAIKSSDIEITDTNERTDEYGDTAYTGTVKNNSEKDTDSIGITLLLYKDGKIVYGDFTFVDNVKAGAEKALDMSEYDVPEHDSYELSGYDWGFN